MDDETKNKVVSIFKNVLSDDSSDTGKANKATHVKGDNNIVMGCRNNVEININSPAIKRNPPPKPTSEHITNKEAQKIQSLIASIAEKEVLGGMDRGKAHAKWHKVLQKRYEITSYHLVPAHLGASAISWLQQQFAIKKTKLKRNDNGKNELYKGIWARSRQLGLSKGEVYNIVEAKLGKKVSSLTNLGEQSLKKLYQIIFAMK